MSIGLEGVGVTSKVSSRFKVGNIVPLGNYIQIFQGPISHFERGERENNFVFAHMLTLSLLLGVNRSGNERLATSWATIFLHYH